MAIPIAALENGDPYAIMAIPYTGLFIAAKLQVRSSHGHGYF
jgi:hypothetical protein